MINNLKTDEQSLKDTADELTAKIERADASADELRRKLRSVNSRRASAKHDLDLVLLLLAGLGVKDYKPSRSTAPKHAKSKAKVMVPTADDSKTEAAQETAKDDEPSGSESVPSVSQGSVPEQQGSDSAPVSDGPVRNMFGGFAGRE